MRGVQGDKLRERAEMEGGGGVEERCGHWNTLSIERGGYAMRVGGDGDVIIGYQPESKRQRAVAVTVDERMPRKVGVEGLRSRARERYESAVIGADGAKCEHVTHACGSAAEVSTAPARMR